MTEDDLRVIGIMDSMCQVLEDILSTIDTESGELYDKVMNMYSLRIMIVTTQALAWADNREKS